MTSTYTIKGMTCNGCRTTVEKLLGQIAGVKKATVVLETETATIEATENIPFATMVNALAEKPKFTITQTAVEVIEAPISIATSKAWYITYYPLLLIVGLILLVSTIAAYQNGNVNYMQLMNSFMAGFFIVFAFFKLLNIKGFANSFAMYDVVAKKIPAYGFIYPFIELGLGILFLLKFNPVFTNIAAAIVMAIGLIGVVESNINKRKIKCACLGDVFNLPMSKITIIENSVMIAMSAYMLYSLFTS